MQRDLFLISTVWYSRSIPLSSVFCCLLFRLFGHHTSCLLVCGLACFYLFFITGWLYFLLYFECCCILNAVIICAVIICAVMFLFQTSTVLLILFTVGLFYIYIFSVLSLLYDIFFLLLFSYMFPLLCYSTSVVCFRPPLCYCFLFGISLLV